jgi:DNA-binding response OmpR family regulator
VRILFVEDSARVATNVKRTLSDAGHSVVVSDDCKSAQAAVTSHTFELGIIDVGLPDGSGLSLCRQLRGGGYAWPILILTARNTIGDRVAGLDAGADDYLGKPFSEAELLARVRALGRRGPRWTESVRAFGDLVIDRDRRLVTRRDERMMLTPRELDVVALLAWADGRVVPREEILESVWGESSESTSASLEVLITRIRRKLDVGRAHSAIRTVRQAGYAWALARSKPR